MHIHLVIQIILDQNSADMGFLLPEPDQIPVLYSSVGFRGRDHIKRFQNIRLALGVVSVENVGSFRKIQVQGLIISEIRKFQ
jgi:hypothetical protein